MTNRLFDVCTPYPVSDKKNDQVDQQKHAHHGSQHDDQFRQSAGFRGMNTKQVGLDDVVEPGVQERYAAAFAAPRLAVKRPNRKS